MSDTVGDAVHRVLIIDDDPLVGEMTLEHVRATGHDARLTSTPEDFMRLHLEWSPTFVIVDLLIDDTDGLEVLSQLASIASDAAVIIASGVGPRVMDAAKRFTAENGLVFAGLLPKPYRRADVAALLACTPQREASSRPAPASDGGGWSDAEFEDAFRAAIDLGAVTVAYQPKVHCRTGKTVGFEALARWTDPARGSISPADFVPMAERLGLVSLLTDAVAHSAFAWFAQSIDDEACRLSINVSASELADPALDRRLVTACADVGLDPSRVILEVTETSAMEDPVASLQVLTRLRLHNFHASLDDFGTGYSSILHLARMPFSEIKIDRSFVTNSGSSEESAIVIRSIIDLAHSLGIECTAEGVQTAESLLLLKGYGCDFAQGFFIAKPMFPYEIGDWLRAGDPAE